MTQLTLERPGRHHVVRSVGPAGIQVGDSVFTGPLILGAQELIDDWPPATLDSLAPEHLQPILDLSPEVVLLGTGPEQGFLHPSRLAPFYRAGVGIEVMTTEAACRTFNVLVMEERRVVAALLPMSP